MATKPAEPDDEPIESSDAELALPDEPAGDTEPPSAPPGSAASEPPPDDDASPVGAAVPTDNPVIEISTPLERIEGSNIPSEIHVVVDFRNSPIASSNDDPPGATEPAPPIGHAEQSSPETSPPQKDQPDPVEAIFADPGGNAPAASAPSAPLPQIRPQPSAMPLALPVMLRASGEALVARAIAASARDITEKLNVIADKKIDDLLYFLWTEDRRFD